MTPWFFLACIIVLTNSSSDDQPQGIDQPGTAQQGNEQLQQPPHSQQNPFQVETFESIEGDGGESAHQKYETFIGQQEFGEEERPDELLKKVIEGEDGCKTSIQVFGYIKQICIAHFLTLTTEEQKQMGLCPDSYILVNEDENNPQSDKFKANLDDYGRILLIQNNNNDGSQSPSDDTENQIRETLKKIGLPLFYDSNTFPPQDKEKKIFKILNSQIPLDITMPRTYISRGIPNPSSLSHTPTTSKDYLLPQIFCVLEDTENEKNIWYLVPLWHKPFYHHRVQHPQMLAALIKHCVAKSLLNYADLASYRLRQETLQDMLPDVTEINE